jgi:hypothetical protein
LIQHEQKVSQEHAEEEEETEPLDPNGDVERNGKRGRDEESARKLRSLPERLQSYSQEEKGTRGTQNATEPGGAN